MTQRYILDTYVTGKYTIPGATIKYREKNAKEWQEIITNEITVEVQSMLDEATEAAGIRDIKSPLNFPDTTYLFIILTVLAILIIMAIAMIFLMKKRKQKQIVTPPCPAHEIAYEALRELQKKDFVKTGNIKEYYFELSNIVRHYLENRFKLRAPEMTTEEFLLKLKYSNALSTEHKSLLREFLSHCDMVKFAKYNPDTGEVKSNYESAKRLIDQTKEINSEVKAD